MITVRNFIELTNASGKKLNKILVNDQLLPVKESYSEVMKKMNEILGG